MDIMAVILTIGMVSGFGLLLYGVFFQKNTEREPVNRKEEIEQFKQSVEDADNTLSNINSVSSLIIEEIDIKYKELLFLYKMLEEKKKEILEQTNASAAGADYSVYEGEDGYSTHRDTPLDSVYNSNMEIMEIGRKMDETKRFPMLKNRKSILELHEKGHDITQIAKELGIGKGEVQLIIGLNKVGVAGE